MTHDLAATLVLAALLGFTAFVAYTHGYRRGLGDGHRGRLVEWARHHQGQR